MKSKLFQEIYINAINFIKNEVSFNVKTKEELYFQQQFNQYLQVEDVLFCYQMLEEGIKINYFQKNKLDELLLKKIHKDQYKYKDIINFKSIKTELKVEALIYSMSNYGFVDYIKREDKSEEEEKANELFNNYENKKLMLKRNKEILNELKSFYSSGIDSTGDFYKQSQEDIDKMRRKYMKSLSLIYLMTRNELFTYQEINEIKNQIKNVCEHLTEKTKRNYQRDSFNRIGKEYLDTFLNLLSKYQEEFLSKDNKKEILLKQLKSYNARNKSLSEEVKDLIDKEKYSIEDLPLEAKKKIENINQIAQSLKNDEVNTFLHERLPVILKKYFSIDEEYRTSLKNVEGYNAQELMIQSLENIERIILAKKEDNNYDMISELSVETRKLKMVK